MQTGRFHQAAILFLSGLAGSWTAEAGAQAYPARAIRVIVPVAAGGGSDFVARLISPKLGEALGQPVVVENRPGGGASIGMEQGLRAVPDGYTLTQVTSTYTVNPSVRPVKYDVTTDYTPIALEGKSPLVLLVHPGVKAGNVKEFIALARAQPERVTYGTSGEGTMVHLANALFAHQAGVRMVHVPYKGGGPALVDLLAGQIQSVMAPPQTGMPYARSGKLRALGMTTARRTRADPDVPTIGEAGLPGYEATIWHGVIGPAGMPRPVAERLNAELRRIVNARDVESLLIANGIEPEDWTPEQFDAHVRRDFELWRQVIRATGIKADG